MLVAALAAACALGVRADDVVTVTGGYSELETLAKKHPFLVVEVRLSVRGEVALGSRRRRRSPATCLRRPDCLDATCIMSTSAASLPAMPVLVPVSSWQRGPCGSPWFRAALTRYPRTRSRLPPPVPPRPPQFYAPWW